MKQSLQDTLKIRDLFRIAFRLGELSKHDVTTSDIDRDFLNYFGNIFYSNEVFCKELLRGTKSREEEISSGRDN